MPGNPLPEETVKSLPLGYSSADSGGNCRLFIQALQRAKRRMNLKNEDKKGIESLFLSFFCFSRLLKNHRQVNGVLSFFFNADNDFFVFHNGSQVQLIRAGA